MRIHREENEKVLLSKLPNLHQSYACFNSYDSIEEFVRHYDLEDKDKYCKLALELIKDYKRWEEVQETVLNEIKEDVISRLYDCYN